MRGNREEAVSELEAGRRTIVRDPDDPRMEANILDNLMVSREDELEDELRAAYRSVKMGDNAHQYSHILETGCAK